MNLVESILKREELSNQIRMRFISSDLYRALQDDITGESVLTNCPEDHFVPWHRGTGPDITFKEMVISRDLLYLNLRVFYISEDERDAFNLNCRTATIEKSYHLHIPVEFVDNFDKVKFNKWVGEKAKERRAKEKQEALRVVKKLFENFPELAKEVLN